MKLPFLGIERGWPGPAGRVEIGVLVVVVVAGLTFLAASSPGVQFVDFVRFSERARELWTGGHLVDRLYPVGYPAMLAVVAPTVGDALVAGKGISVVAAALLGLGVAHRLGLGAGTFVLCAHSMLLAGSTEGTDMAALSLSLLAVVYGDRPALAAGLVAAAVLTRYTAIAAVPVVLLRSPRRSMTLGLLLALTSPHWLTALCTGASVLPDQSENITIAAGAPVPLLSLETLRRWPRGFWLALTAGLHEPATWLGLLGFAVALCRGSWASRRVALAVLGFGLLHAAALGLAFSNERLALPITACVSIGAAWLLPSRWLFGLALVVGVVNARLPGDNVMEAARARAVAQLLIAEPPGPVITTSPWFYRWDGPWVVGGIGLSGLGAGRSMTPASLRGAMQQTGATLVALEVSRTRRAAPGLGALLSGPPPAGWTSVGQPRGWRVWR